MMPETFSPPDGQTESISELRGKLSTMTVEDVEEQKENGEAVNDIIEDIIDSNSDWAEEQVEQWMERKHGSKSKWFGLGGVLHSIRRYMSGDYEDDKLSQFLGEHKSKLKLFGGATGLALGILTANPVVASIGGAYLVRGGVEGIKKRIRLKTEGQTSQEELILGLDKQVKMGIEAKILFAQELAKDLVRLNQPEKEVEFYEKLAQLVEFVRLASREAVGIEYYKDNVGEIKARVKGSNQDGQVVASANLGELMGKSLKSDLIFSLLETGGGIAGGALGGAAAVLHGMDKLHAGITFMPGEKFEAVNIAKDVPPPGVGADRLADYHRLVTDSSNTVRFARTAAEKSYALAHGYFNSDPTLGVVNPGLGSIPQWEIAKKAMRLIQGLNHSAEWFSGLSAAERFSTLAHGQGEKIGQLTSSQKADDQDLEKYLIDLKPKIKSLKKLQEQETTTETKDKVLAGDTYSVDGLGVDIIPGSVRFIKVFGLDVDNKFVVGMLTKFDESEQDAENNGRLQRLTPEEFQKLVVQGDKKAERVHRKGEILPDEKKKLKESRNASILEAAEKAIADKKIGKVVLNPKMSAIITLPSGAKLDGKQKYELSSIKMDQEIPEVSLTYIDKGQRKTQKFVLSEVIQYISAINTEQTEAEEPASDSDLTAVNTQVREIMQQRSQSLGPDRAEAIPTSQAFQVGQVYELHNNVGILKPYIITELSDSSDIVNLREVEIDPRTGDLRKEQGRLILGTVFQSIQQNRIQLAKNFRRYLITQEKTPPQQQRQQRRRN